MYRNLVFIFLIFFSFNVFATMKVSYSYPNNKKSKTIKVYTSKGVAFVVLNENGNEISKMISQPLFEQIRKNILKLVSKRSSEFSCPKRIMLSVSLNDKRKIFCESNKEKKTVAKLFRKLHEISVR